MFQSVSRLTPDEPYSHPRMECPLIVYTDVDTLGLLGVFGEYQVLG